MKKNLTPEQIKKRDFALEQIKEYFIDPNKCGYDKEAHICCYISSEGNMCVAGKNMIEPEIFKDKNLGIEDILNSYGGQVIFKPQSRYILEDFEWYCLQVIHDGIAKKNDILIRQGIINLNLFTKQELVEYCNK